MMTTFFASQTFALLPNSRLKTPIVPGPHTSWVMRTSTLTHTLSPGWTCALPEARARTFSVSVIRLEGQYPRGERAVQIQCGCDRRATQNSRSPAAGMRAWRTHARRSRSRAIRWLFRESGDKEQRARIE